MRPAAFFTTAVTYCSHGERFGGAHWPVRIRYVRPRGCPSRRPAERVENLRIPAQVRDIGIQRGEVILTCGGIRLSPIQSWPGAPCPGCAEGQLRRYFLIIEDSQAKKIEEAVWRAMVIGPVAVAELLPPAVISVVPAPRFGRAGAFVTWMHPVSVISAMAVHN